MSAIRNLTPSRSLNGVPLRCGCFICSAVKCVAQLAKPVDFAAIAIRTLLILRKALGIPSPISPTICQSGTFTESKMIEI